MLDIDYVVGSRPRIQDGAIEGISDTDYPDPDFKLYETKQILNELGIKPDETIAIGDGMGDKSRFLFAGTSIAINPSGGIEEYANHIIRDDLKEAIPILQATIV